MPVFETDNDMTRIFDKYNTDKNSTFHNYPYYYHRYLNVYRNKKDLRYLEIGVHSGESLRAFREYFNNAVEIVGIDIIQSAKIHEDIGNGVLVEIGDQSDRKFLQDVHNKHGPFDVILDDGSHLYDDIVNSFQILFPLLSNGGVYIIEDTICIRDRFEYFHSLTTHLNHWRKDSGSGDHCVDPFKIELTVADPVAYSVGDIIFSNSCIIIFKDIKHHWII